jgi:hypothetical protein
MLEHLGRNATDICRRDSAGLLWKRHAVTAVTHVRLRSGWQVL